MAAEQEKILKFLEKELVSFQIAYIIAFVLIITNFVAGVIFYLKGEKKAKELLRSFLKFNKRDIRINLKKVEEL